MWYFFLRQLHFLCYLFEGKLHPKLVHFDIKHPLLWYILHIQSAGTFYASCGYNSVLSKPSWLIFVTNHFKVLLIFNKSFSRLCVAAKHLRQEREHCSSIQLLHDNNAPRMKIDIASLQNISLAWPRMGNFQQNAYIQGEHVYLHIINLVSLGSFTSYFISLHLSFDVFCFVNNHPKGGRLLVQFLPPCVLEIVDRNRHGLICFLVHAKRNSPCGTEEECQLWCQVEGTSPKDIWDTEMLCHISQDRSGEKIDAKKLAP